MDVVFYILYYCQITILPHTGYTAMYVALEIMHWFTLESSLQLACSLFLYVRFCAARRRRACLMAPCIPLKYDLLYRQEYPAILPSASLSTPTELPIFRQQCLPPYFQDTLSGWSQEVGTTSAILNGLHTSTDYTRSGSGRARRASDNEAYAPFPT